MRARAAAAARRRGRDDGSAVVDFALVGALVTVLFAGVLQLAVVQHVRNVLVDSAAEGARYAALVGHGPSDGEDRTRTLVEQALSAGYAQDVVAQRTTLDGLAVVDVRVVAPLPLVGLLGPSGRITVHGHALDENG